jgi:hypothetical protein
LLPRAAFAPPASGRHPFPDFLARMRPSDSPAASAAAPVPLAVDLPQRERFSAPAARAFANVRRVGGLRSGSSAAPEWSWTNRGLPGYWVVRRRRAMVVHPAGCVVPLPTNGDDDCCLQGWQTLGHPEARGFRGRISTAQRLVCLRIGRAVTTAAARLTTGLPGSALTGRDSHPLDDNTEFPTSPLMCSFQSSIAWTHCHPAATPGGIYVFHGKRCSLRRHPNLRNRHCRREPIP